MLYVFSVLDKAVGAFMPPFFVRAKGEAVRTFNDAVNEKSSPFYKHPLDFELYMIGHFDPDKGQITPCLVEKVVAASDVLEKM